MENVKLNVPGKSRPYLVTRWNSGELACLDGRTICLSPDRCAYEHTIRGKRAVVVATSDEHAADAIALQLADYSI